MSNDANEDMSDDPSVRKRLRRRGKTRWREERTTIESSRSESVIATYYVSALASEVALLKLKPASNTETALASFI